jgi:Fe-S-cluster-containing hydrogenase component 2/CRP-like cAMP-binding protein
MATRDVPRKVELRTGDALLTYNRIRAISLFGDLTPRMEGRLRGLGGQGAVVVRRYRAGEIICRQGEPGWTAFYLPGAEDVLTLRKTHRILATTADEKLARRAPDKLTLPRRARRKAAEELERTGGDAELAELLFASAGRPEEGEIEALTEEIRRLDEGEAADAELAARHAALSMLDPPAKQRRADEVAAVDPRLAALLRASALAAEERVRAVVSVARAVDTGAAGAAAGGLLGRLVDRLRGGPAAAGVVEEPIATLVEGELFGELSCLYHAPRTATVRAVRDLYAIELLGNVLDMLLGSRSFRSQLDETYRARSLARDLGATDVFAGVPADVLSLLTRGAEFVSLAPGQVLFEEGAPADGAYLVRGGTVKLYRRGAEDRPLGHRSRGETLGWGGALGGAARSATCAGYEHPRASGKPGRRELPSPPVELVRLDTRLHGEAIARFPALEEAIARAARGDEPARGGTALGTSRFDDLGLMQGRSLLLVDLDRCTRCDDCVRACADVQADGFPRLSLEGPRFGNYLVAASCRKCADAACLVGCPVRSIHKGAAGQIVIESWCVGCGMCAEQCPYQAIDVRALPAPKQGATLEGDAPPGPSERAVTCDQCAAIPGGPRCVAACAHDAARRVDARDFFARAKLR